MANQWLTGAGVPSTGVGQVTDYYRDTASNLVYYRENAFTWTVVPAFTPNPDGIGTTWLSGVVAPTTEIGSSGDYYYDDNDKIVYRKSGSDWIAKGSLDFIGIYGVQWGNGIGAPASTVPLNALPAGSFYLNVETSDIYYKEPSMAWVLKGQLGSGSTAQTTADAIATAADRVQTGLDVLSTAADRVQTALDVISTAADALSCSASEEASALSESNAEVFKIEAETAKTEAETARDAAIATGKIYATTAAGLAATTSGQYFNIVSAGTNDYVDLYLNSAGSAVYQKTYPASALVAQHTLDITSLKNSRTALEASVLQSDTPKNLYNPATKRAGMYVKTNAVIDVASGWACSDYIPVTVGQQYTISANASKREGVAFFTSNLTNTGISGSYIAGGTLPMTVTAPATAAYMVINVQSASIAEPSQVQVESGATATAYEAWRLPTQKVTRDGLTDALKAELDTIVKEYETTITSKNLFSIAAVRDGKYLSSSNGAVNSATGWGMSGFIPVVAGQQYTISGTRGRDGVSFFTAASDGSLVAGSYVATAGLPLTVTAPVTATYMAINLYSSSSPVYTQVQVELGTSATEYTFVFGSHRFADKSKITPAIKEMPDNIKAKLVLDSTATTPSYIQALLSGSTTDILKVVIKPFNTRNLSTSELFNFYEERLNEIKIRDASDDIAPYRVFGGTIGANHGYGKSKCTVTGHTKTSADVGSVWTDGTNQWVIVDVAANLIYMTARTTNSHISTGTLTHVSGATNTASFSPSAFVSEQWYPAIKNRLLTCSVDNQLVTDLNGTFYYYDNVTFSESCEIMNKSSIVEWLITQVGLSPTPAQYSGTGDISVSMSYVFDKNGNCAIYQDFLVLNNVTLFQDIMFTQAIKMTAGVSGAVKYYVPKSLPLTHESVAYDFRTLRDMTGFAPSTRIDFTPARCEATGQLCDRMLMLNDSVGIAFGYLPTQSADPSVRRVNASNKALQISEAAKLYMSCIDGLKTTLVAGDYFSVVAYRSYFKRQTARTSCYVVRNKTGVYLYADWHSATVDRLPVPPDCVGKSFTVVEKSANVTVKSQCLTNSLVVDISSAASYGYLVIKITQ